VKVNIKLMRPCALFFTSINEAFARSSSISYGLQNQGATIKNFPEIIMEESESTFQFII